MQSQCNPGRDRFAGVVGFAAVRVMCSISVKSDKAKVQIAQRLGRQTTVTWDWIAHGFVMGAGRYAANAAAVASARS